MRPWQLFALPAAVEETTRTRPEVMGRVLGVVYLDLGGSQ